MLAGYPEGCDRPANWQEDGTGVRSNMPALSREFLLSRGSCCWNGCKNCPYTEEKVEEPIFIARIPFDMSNSNDGQGHAWYRTAAVRKAISDQLARQGMQRETFQFPVRLRVTRILGPRQRLWDSDSILRGSYKQLQDTLVDAGWFHDDSPKYITEVLGKQDKDNRSEGPAVLIEVFKDGSDDALQSAHVHK
jgi:hypothetical protein